MSDFGSNNPYYAPEKCGLTIVGVLDDPNADYSFSYVVVWKDAAGKLYGAHDSGCSCPSPFEDFHNLSQLTPIRTEDDFRKLVADAYTAYTPSDVLDLAKKVRDLL